MRERLTSKKIYGAGKLFGSFFAVFSLIFLRYIYFGFVYYPQLDDYIQYHNYAAMGTLGEMISYLGLLRARPLAGILDIALWSRFWGNMGIALLLLSMVYALSAMVFYCVFQNLYGAGRSFLLFYTLLPIGLEGSYWISASTRILPGLLFCALSAYTFYHYLQNRRFGFLMSAVFFQLLAFCFYEQAAVLSCGLNVIIGFSMRKTARSRFAAAFSCFGVAAVYFTFCMASGDSALYGGRDTLMLPTTAYYFRQFLPDLLSQVYSVFIRGGVLIMTNGIFRGTGIILRSNGVWKLVLYFFVCILSFFVCIRARENNGGGVRRYAVQIGWGALLALLPLAPFFILANPYFSLRGALPSLPGISLVLDGVFRCLLRKEKLISIAAALCATLFFVVTVSELSDYRENYMADTAVTRSIAKTPMHGEKIAVFGLKDSFLATQNFAYHEHISGVTSSSWALTGAVRCVKENVFEKVTYIPYDSAAEFLYKPWNYEEKQIGGIDAAFVYDMDANALFPLRVTETGEGVYTLYTEDDAVYGQIVEEGRAAKFFRK